MKNLFILISILLLVLNAGKYFDVTSFPKKSDIIFCLGGTGKERIIKSVKLLDNGYGKLLYFSGCKTCILKRVKIF